MTTFNWTFTALHCDTAKADHTDVVYGVSWLYVGVHADGYTAQVCGDIACSYEEGDPFIPFTDLQFSDVEGWVTDGLGPSEIEEMEANIEIQIANAIAPKQVVIRKMPWAQTEAEVEAEVEN